ncbi:hypothetical protein EJ04DRAFT_337559 [Polyplosphaeria fusca]|uniref:Uncharacterized protein n=1 Tax=Polyplosphaeria fusca TaxID=682080 RepID=A0A9P4QWS7_9PLEO|nr:hypothetical protein EJ04DRAFT_337559 [Polyplosphaeria fusca]
MARTACTCMRCLGVRGTHICSPAYTLCSSEVQNSRAIIKELSKPRLFRPELNISCSEKEEIEERIAMASSNPCSSPPASPTRTPPFSAPPSPLALSRISSTSSVSSTTSSNSSTSTYLTECPPEQDQKYIITLQGQNLVAGAREAQLCFLMGFALRKDGGVHTGVEGVVGLG